MREGGEVQRLIGRSQHKRRDRSSEPCLWAFTFSCPVPMHGTDSHRPPPELPGECLWHAPAHKIGHSPGSSHPLGLWHSPGLSLWAGPGSMAARPLPHRPPPTDRPAGMCPRQVPEQEDAGQVTRIVCRLSSGDRRDAELHSIQSVCANHELHTSHTCMRLHTYPGRTGGSRSVGSFPLSRRSRWSYRTNA